MKNSLILGCLCSLLYACKAPSYSYVPPTLNTTAYTHAGEGQLGVQFGSVGLAAKGGIAITKNININAWAGTFPKDSTNYTSKESEVSIGVQTNPNSSKSYTSFWIGLGNGHNEKELKQLSGHFNRAFLQVQESAVDHHIGSAAFDAFIGFRVNYLSYSGSRLNAPFSDYLFYYEPYFGANIGGENFRVELLQGLAMKNTGEWGHGVQVWPYWGSIGFMFKLRTRKHTHEH